MARLADRFSLEDDELSRLQSSIRLSTRKSRRTASSDVEASDKQNLVPKCISTHLTRKIRRLGSGTGKNTNPLFLPWNADDDSSQAPSLVYPRRSPKRPKKSQRFPQHPISQSIQDVSSPSTRPHRARRHRASPPSKEEPAEVGFIGGQPSLQCKTPTLAIARGRAASKLDVLIAEDYINVTATRQMLAAEKAAPRLPAEVSDAIAVSDDEEPSDYKTADECMSGTSDGSTSDFELDDSSSESFEALLQLQMVTRTGRNAARDISPMALSLEKPFRGRKTLARGSVQVTIPSSRATELSKALGKLQIGDEYFSAKGIGPGNEDNLTLPSTPPKTSRPGNLVSPRKLSRIPQTPCGPGIDDFWNQDSTDYWNDRHSQAKPSLLPVPESPAKRGSVKAGKRSFDSKKRLLAEDFLRELDTEITHGKISELVAPTGGVKIIWTKALNTTAGRANWRRETIMVRSDSDTPISVCHKHHASIELADKVIDNENRLLNVLAHEFCHLANFMVSGITNNPHGKEFKSWAAKCSHAFGDSRGIHVTTKHAYEIDFKYIWACTACGSEYKRHSKSIDPQRHRCGSCKSTLTQTRPVPKRRDGAGGGRAAKSSDWQMFFKEKMKTEAGESRESSKRGDDYCRTMGQGQKGRGVDTASKFRPALHSIARLERRRR